MRRKQPDEASYGDKEKASDLEWLVEHRMCEESFM